MNEVNGGWNEVKPHPRKGKQMDIETKMAITHALLQLEREGMLVGFNYNRDGEIPFFIPAQPIPDIPNWQEWCRKLQECGVKFEFGGGFMGVTKRTWENYLKTYWGESKCEFTAEVHRYHILEQPVPATIVNYLNEEKTMSENTNKPKSIKLQLPEIEVSEDVTDVKVCFYDSDRLLHSTVGVAIMNFKVGNGSLLGVGRRNNHYIHGAYYTKEEFDRATQPPKEMTVEEVEKILGHKVKIVGKTK